MMCDGVKLTDRKTRMEFMSMVGLSEDIVTLVRRLRLPWHGHVLSRNEEVGIRRALEFDVDGVTGRGRPRFWMERMSEEKQSGSWVTGC